MGNIKRGFVQEMRLKEEERVKQEELREKYHLQNKDIIVVEKSNTYKFTIKTLAAFIKSIASLVLIVLAMVGIAALIYPSIRIPFFNVLSQTIQQVQFLIGF